jgi:hypothetical protein
MFKTVLNGLHADYNIRILIELSSIKNLFCKTCRQIAPLMVRYLAELLFFQFAFYRDCKSEGNVVGS